MHKNNIKAKSLNKSESSTLTSTDKTTLWAIKNQTCLSVDNSAMVTRRKACYMSKVLVCCRERGPNLHSKSFQYSLPNLHKSSLPPKLGICPHSHVPEFIEFKNLLQKCPDLNSVNYSVWGIAADSTVTKFQ